MFGRQQIIKKLPKLNDCTLPSRTAKAHHKEARQAKLGDAPYGVCESVRCTTRRQQTYDSRGVLVISKLLASSTERSQNRMCVYSQSCWCRRVCRGKCHGIVIALSWYVAMTFCDCKLSMTFPWECNGMPWHCHGIAMGMS